MQIKPVTLEEIIAEHQRRLDAGEFEDIVSLANRWQIAGTIPRFLWATRNCMRRFGMVGVVMTMIKRLRYGGFEIVYSW